MDGRGNLFLDDGAVHLLHFPSQGIDGHAPGYFEDVRGINAARAFVGIWGFPMDASLNSYQERAYIYDGTWHDVGVPGTSTTPLAISDKGLITDYTVHSAVDLNFNRAFLHDGKMHDIGALAPKWSTIGRAVNDVGEVVGDRIIGPVSGSASHAFLYDGTMHDLGTLGGSNSRATDINAAGLIVGDSELADQSTWAAFVSDGNRLVELNRRIVGSRANYHLVTALAINARCQILMSNDSFGRRSYFLLTPTTEALAAPPPCVDTADSPHGTHAAIEHRGGDTTLTFTDLCGKRHVYAVMRPRIAPGMPPASDAGGWVYAEPNRRSGFMFNVTNSGDVTSNRLSGPALQMMVGP